MLAPNVAPVIETQSNTSEGTITGLLIIEQRTITPFTVEPIGVFGEFVENDAAAEASVCPALKPRRILREPDEANEQEGVAATVGSPPALE
jgi:hypothetical protein